MENVLKEEKELYLMRDFNRDLSNVQIKNAWTDYMEPLGLTQLLSEATRVTNDTRTLIDHIYSNCPENVNSLNIPNIGLSDHFPIFLIRKCMFSPLKPIITLFPIGVLKILMKLNLLKISLFHGIQ